MSAERSNEVAVLFIHGMRTSGQIWDSQLEAVRALGYPALAIDLPGHGKHAASRFTFEGAFAEIDNALSQLGLPTILVGLSLGGYTSLAYTAAHPNAPIIGVVAAACAGDPKGKPIALYRDISAIVNHGFTLFGRGLRHLRNTPEPEPGPPWQIVTDSLTELSGHCELDDILAIQVPIWFVNGARDPLRLQAKQFAAQARDGASVIIPNAGHDVNSESPQAFNKILLRALSEFTAE
ncbi:MAG: alpha/beta hydrolase [Cellulomonadaceae bacterium]|nr:alpha/beta hydrolase [Cellulomonadaceae bacterium]